MESYCSLRIAYNILRLGNNGLPADTTVSNLSAIVAGTWKVGIDGVLKYLSPNTKIEFRKLLATVHGLPDRTN